jgi:hypothetical protein
MQRKMECYSADVWSRINKNISSKDFIRVIAEKMNWLWISANNPQD